MVFANTSELVLVIAVVGATLGFVVAAADSTSSVQSTFNNVEFVRECDNNAFIVEYVLYSDYRVLL